MVILMIITIFNLSCAAPVPGGLPYETDGDARRLALGCKFWILVLLRVFQA